MKKIISVIFFLFTISITLTSCFEKKVELSDIYSVEFSKNDNGEGTATISYNFGMLKSRLGFKEDEKVPFITQAFISTIDFDLTPNTELSNGQELTVTCTWDEDIAKQLKLNPTFTESKIKVPDNTFRVLREITKKELFDTAYIDVSGIYPDLNIDVHYKETTDITDYFELQVDSVDYDKNIVLVSAVPYSDDSIETIRQVEGLIFKPMTIELPLPSYMKYLNSLDSITLESKKNINADGIKAVKKDLDYYIRNNILYVGPFSYAKNEEERSKHRYDEPILEHVYLINVKDGMQPRSTLFRTVYNRLTLLYTVKIYDHENTDGKLISLPVLFDNIYISSENILEYDKGHVSDAETYNEKDYLKEYVTQYSKDYDGFDITGEDFLK